MSGMALFVLGRLRHLGDFLDISEAALTHEQRDRDEQDDHRADANHEHRKPTILNHARDFSGLGPNAAPQSCGPSL
jgi:hypothetical protein